MLDEAIRLKNETNSSSSASKLPPPLTSLLKKVFPPQVINRFACVYVYIIIKDLKKKNEYLYEEDVPLSKRRKESPRSSQPSSPATRYDKTDIL